jgi:TRAP-type C4-dicarboxylate transport system substrate-binding protein
MMLKKFRCLALVMALILVVVSGTTFAAKKPVKLVYGTIFAKDHPFVKADEYFKKIVKKNSKGQILIDYFPVGQLGSQPEMQQATKFGSQHLFGGGIPMSFWSKLQTIELPYLFRDEAHQLKVASKLASIIDQNELGAKTGMRIIGVRLRSPRHLVTKFPVHKLEDIKGLKLRVPPNQVYGALWRALGAVPTIIPGPDTYTALATGTVDAAENPFADIYAWKYQEQLKWCALTGHVRSINAMQINNNCWNSLTAKQRKILTNAAKKSCKFYETLRKENERKYKELLTKGGMKFSTPDITPFREKAKTIWSQFGDEEWIEKIEAIK